MSDQTDGKKRNAGHDEWLDALRAGNGYALCCPEGHGSLPPRRVCPECGSTELDREPLDETGTVETASTVHVPSPGFADDAPYVNAIADFGIVRLTGVLRGVEDDVDGPDGDDGGDGNDRAHGADGGNSDAVDTGLVVRAGVEERETDGKPLVVFRPNGDKNV